jgi:hypothetical protein
MWRVAEKAGLGTLFVGAEGERLDRFACALCKDERSHFIKVTLRSSKRCRTISGLCPLVEMR